LKSPCAKGAINTSQCFYSFGRGAKHHTYADEDVSYAYGPGLEMIVTGDTTQIDLPTNQKSGLKEAVRILNQTKGIGFVELNERDVVRHKLVRDIVEAYGKAGS